MKNLFINDYVFGGFSRLLNEIIETTTNYADENSYQMFSTTDGWVILIDVVGVDKEAISLEFEDGHLKVKSECEPFPVNHVFALGKDVNVENIDAYYSDGLLKLNLPKANSQKNININ